MNMDLEDGRPIYVQIMDKIRKSIVSGTFMPGQKIMSVREGAAEFGVNPNTMQRALSELEREGVIQSERTTGKFVTKDKALIETIRMEEAQRLVRSFEQEMLELGFSTDEILTFFRQDLTEEIG